MDSSEFKVCVVGLGYVGLPLALALDKKFEVYGFDVNTKRIQTLRDGIDINGESLGEDLTAAKIEYSDSPEIISKSNFIIVGVPTPITEAKTPDLKYLKSASEMVAKNIQKGAIVVFESTVYPGVTEEYCAPIIEEVSGLKCGVDFKVGYSPERINPGDHEHTVDKITKVVSGMDADSLEKISFVYGQVTKTFEATSIKVAEAAKVIENTQRDLNIALVNELSLIFKKMNIDTLDVLEAAGTKWNFLNFRPGLVGGHCIGVDPYYLTHKAKELGYNPQVILAGRRINDNMPKEVVRLVLEGLNKNKKPMNGSKVLVLGATFKENVTDARNSKVEDIIVELERLGADVMLNDPMFEGEVRYEHFSKELTSLDDAKDIDAVIYAVPHDAYNGLDLAKIKAMMKDPVIVDIKGVLGKDEAVMRL